MAGGVGVAACNFRPCRLYLYSYTHGGAVGGGGGGTPCVSPIHVHSNLESFTYHTLKGTVSPEKL